MGSIQQTEHCQEKQQAEENVQISENETEIILIIKAAVHKKFVFQFQYVSEVILSKTFNWHRYQHMNVNGIL